jgi:hypothetical protein
MGDTGINRDLGRLSGSVVSLRGVGHPPVETTGALFMSDWWSQYHYLMIGIMFFSGAVVSTCTGKTSARIGRWIYRAEEPSTFWWVLAIYYLSALFCV